MKYLTLFFIVLSCSVYGQNVRFTENKNQWDKKINLRTEVPGGVVFFENNCFTYHFWENPRVNSPHAQKIEIPTVPILSTNITPIYKAAPAKKYTKHHAFRMSFRDANPLPQILKLNSSTDYVNYLLGDSSKHATFVKSYANVEYLEIFPGIDMKISGANEGFIYDFVLQPNANPDHIILDFDGISNINIDNGDLTIKTSINIITEFAPKAYQIIAGDTIQVKCNFNLRNKTLRFDFPDGYDKNYALVIDPTLIFSTYSGSTADNWGSTAAFDSRGNTFSGGIAENMGYPTSLGAYQTQYGGGNWDIAIIKYNTTGSNRLWATYLGGNQSELAHSLIANSFDELVIYGTTGSSDFPTSPNAFDRTFNGGDPVVYDGLITYPNGIDIFVSRLSEDGTILRASTFIGGSGTDGLNFKAYYDSNPTNLSGNDSLYMSYGDGARGELNIDDQNNIYVGSCTFSTNFPVTATALQKNSGGRQDGIVFKMDNLLSNLIWSTYIGGGMDDAVFSTDVDSKYNLYIAGATNSTNFPTLTGAYNKTYNGGGADGFVSCISYNGTKLMGSTYFGTSAADQTYFVRTGKDDDVYLYGLTRTTDNTLVRNAKYSNPNSGQFLARLSPSLENLRWSTVFGTGENEPNLSPTAFSVDACDRIYVSGSGRDWPWSHSMGWRFDTNTGMFNYDLGWSFVQGTKNMPITPDAYETKTDGQDFYLAIFTRDAAKLEYATFFGELDYFKAVFDPNTGTVIQNTGCLGGGTDHVDGGTSRFDKKGNIYQSVCGSCNKCQHFPTGPGNVWSTSNNSNNCNNAVFKFNVGVNLVDADFDTPPIGCGLTPIQFENKSNGVTYKWDFGDGNTSSVTNPLHPYSKGGLYTVNLIATDPNSCNYSDTISKLIQILPLGIDTLPDENICNGTSVQIGLPPVSDNTIIYQWTPTSGLSNPNIANPFASPTQTTRYKLKLTKSVCIDSVFQTVRVATAANNIKLMNEGNQVSGTTISKCKQDTLKLNVTPYDPAWEYYWASEPTFTNLYTNSLRQSELKLYITSDTKVYLKVVSPCNDIKFDSVFVKISRVAIRAEKEQTICLGKNAVLNIVDTITTNVLTTIWSPSSAITGTNSGNTITVNPNRNTRFMAKSTNQYGCSGTAYVMVRVKPINIQILQLDKTKCDDTCNGNIFTESTLGTEPYLYSWNNGATTPNLTNVCIGDYTLTVTDANGCMGVLNVKMIEEFPILLSVEITPITCNGSSDASISIHATGNSVPFLYSLNGSTYSNVNAYSGLTQGNYQVKILDSKNCTKTQNITITNPEVLDIALNYKSDIVCFNQKNGVISLSATGGTVPYKFSLNSGTKNTNGNFNDLLPGNYKAKVEDKHLCLDSLDIIISEPTQTFVASNWHSDNVCFGDNTGKIFVAAAGGIPPTLYSLDNINFQPTGLFENLKSGKYQVVIKDVNQCQVLDTILINTPPKLSIYSFNYQNIKCHNETNGSILVWASGGRIPMQYSIDKTNFFPIGQFQNLPASVYTINVSDAGNCFVEKTIEIVNPAILDLTINFQSNITCNGFDNGIINTSSIGGTPPHRYTLDNIEFSNQGNFKFLPTGKYYPKVIDANGCVSSEFTTIIEPDTLIITEIYTTNFIQCFGESAGNMIVKTIGGSLPLTYSIDGMNYTSINTFNNLPAQKYAIWIKDAHNCISGSTFSISQPAMIQIISNNSTEISCHNKNDGLIHIVAVGGTGILTYNLWSIGAKTVGYFDKLVENNYLLQITDENHCIITTNILITNPELLDIFVNFSSNISCYGFNNGIINISANGGIAPYKFSINHSIYTNTTMYQGLIPNSYQLQVIDKNSCVSSNEITISEPTQIQITSNEHTNNEHCFGDNIGIIHIEANGGTSPILYSIDNMNYSSQTWYKNLAAGVYPITIIDKNSCTSTFSITIDQPELLYITDNSTTNITCNHADNGEIFVNAMGGFGIKQYSINGSIFTNNGHFNKLNPGKYTVVTKDEYNCLLTNDFIISEPPVIKISDAYVVPISCNDASDAQLIINVIGGSPPYFFSLDNGNTQSTNSVFTAIGQGIYVVSVTDKYNCPNVKSNSLVVNNPPKMIVQKSSKKDNLCYGYQQGEIEFNVSGGISPILYSINEGSFSIYNKWNNLEEGNYKVIAKDNHKCLIINTFNIVSPPVLSYGVATQNVFCFDDCKGEASVHLNPAYNSLSILWNNQFSTPFIKELCAGNFDVSVSNTNGCKEIHTFNIVQPEKLKVEVTEKQRIKCFGDTITLRFQISGGISPYTRIWNENNSLFQNTIYGVKAGVYTINIIDANNCKEKLIYKLNEPSKMEIQSTISLPSCSTSCNGQILISPYGGVLPYFALWNTGNTTLNYYKICPGNYSLTISDSLSCTINETFEINHQNYLPPLTIFATTDTIYSGQQTEIFTNDTYDLNTWDNFKSPIAENISIITVSPNITTRYRLKITDNIGCINYDTITIFIKEISCDDEDILVANTITPEITNEGNHLLQIHTDILKKVNIVVYSRWGESIFESSSQNNAWDGTYKGSIVQQGVYVWHLTGQCWNGKYIEKKGNVTVIR